MFEFVLIFGTMGLGLMIASELENCIKKQNDVSESTSDKLTRLESKADEILNQIKELKEQK